MIELDTENKILYCKGEWTLKTFMQIKKLLDEIEHKPINIINGEKITKMDSAGAVILEAVKYKDLVGFSDQHLKLLKLIPKDNQKWQSIPEEYKPNPLENLGMITVKKIAEFMLFLSFIGEVALTCFKLLFKIKNISLRSIIVNIEVTGVYALPIIALLSFLIGMVLAYQMGLQLKNYGANIYIVDLLGLSILREFAPLMTAIIVAGRSGSAFTAQLGTMKIREEIDALQTMQLSPLELLVIPRLIAMFFVLPLLTVWASLFAIIGGMIVSHSMLHVAYADFLHRFYEAIPLRAYFTGMIKTPVFGLIIAAVGCFQGMQVFGSATSVGEKTTVSVVQSIFFIIIADAIFSILFSWLKL